MRLYEAEILSSMAEILSGIKQSITYVYIKDEELGQTIDTTNEHSQITKKATKLRQFLTRVGAYKILLDE